MRQINKVTNRVAILKKYTTYSRIWEYPWVWRQLEPLKGWGLKVVDIGSERSPFPWFLATQGFKVTVSDVTPDYWRTWKRAEHLLGVRAYKCILDAQNLDLPTASVDILLSVSVIEHVPDKARVISEAARVLRPGGLLVMTFDICEPEMGMTFPEWNGRALTMHEFDELFKNSPWFESGLSELSWNVEDIPDYLAWHRTTAPWHNYVTGAAIVYRNNHPWIEPRWKNLFRIFRGKFRTFYLLTRWHLNHK